MFASHWAKNYFTALMEAHRPRLIQLTAHGHLLNARDDNV
jgi:hypothetical protein